MAKAKSSDSAKTEESIIPTEPVKIMFSKGKILTFRRYAKRVDLLATLLNEGKEYTLAEVDFIINEFMKGQVN